MFPPARFITFEGIDGCGKTTQLRRLARRLREQGLEVVETVEPGGNPVGEQIRKLLLDPANSDITPRTELLLYFASRAQNVDRIIRPALERGATVLCDRFTDSTLVYQGAGRGLDADTVIELDRIACRGLKPDLTFLLDIDLDTSLHRARRRNARGNGSESRIDDESTSFHRAVREGYLRLAALYTDRIMLVDGRGGIEEVGERIEEALRARV